MAMDPKAPPNVCITQSVFSVPKRTAGPVDTIVKLPITTVPISTTTPTPVIVDSQVDLENEDKEMINFLDDNSLQNRIEGPQCSGDHCHQVFIQILGRLNQLTKRLGSRMQVRQPCMFD